MSDSRNRDDHHAPRIQQRTSHEDIAPRSYRGAEAEGAGPGFGSDGRATFELDLLELLPLMQVWARRRTTTPDAANDLLQDTLVRALQSRSAFIHGTNLRGWLYMIMRNLAADDGRRRSRRGPHVSLDQTDLGLSSGPRQDGDLEVRDLQRAFSRLSGAHQELLLRVVSSEETYEELAAAYGIAVGTVKSRVARARLRLRAELDRQEGDHDGEIE